ncbi:gag-protease polyprotein, partial [Trifolium medium]|nr:gag-protease polyprotein [Trifolium medium]
MPHIQYPYVAAVARGQHPQQLHPIPSPQQPLMIPQQNHQQQQGGYQQRNQSGPRNTYEKKIVHFDPVPMPYDQILPYLVQKGMVELKPLKPLVPPYPPFFDENARCDYHAGSSGHNIGNCRAFKLKVQELIDRKLLSFKE